MKNKIMKAGGITLAPEFIGRPDDAYNFFVTNSVSRGLISKGAYGRIYILEFKPGPGIVSPYLSFNHLMEFEEVRRIVAKLVIVNDDEDDYVIGNNSDEMRSTSNEEFNKEINIQKKIIEKTGEYLDPIGPSIIYTYETTADNIFFFTERIQKESESNKRKLVSVDKSTLTCGVIIMELLSDMNTLYNKLGDYYTPYDIYKCMTSHYQNKTKIKLVATYAFLLINLADNGFIHCDYYTRNTLSKVFLDGRIEAKLLDFGRSKEITEVEKAEVKRLINLFITSSLQQDNFTNLKNLVEYIHSLNMKVFKATFERSHTTAQFNNKVTNFYGWFIYVDILKLIRLPLLKIFEENEGKKNQTLLKCRELVSLDIRDVPRIIDQAAILHGQSILVLPLDPDFKNHCVASTVEPELKQTALEPELKRTALASSQSSPASSQSSQSSVSSTESESDKAKRDKIAEGRRLLQIAIDSGQYSGLTKKQLQTNFKEGYKLLKDRFYYEDSTTDGRLIDLVDVKDSKRPGYVEDSQALLIALIYPNFFPPEEPRKGGAASPSQLQPEPELQQIILEPVKTEDKAFAEWRDAIYKKYTEPDVKKREEYYSNLTPFAILIHVMVCCGLFGPLSSGQYINVAESHPQYNRLNSIAAAFSTMNNGYISMTRLRLETMMPSLGNRSVSAVDPTMVNVDVDNTKSINLEEANTVNLEEANTVNALEAYGGKRRKTKRQTRRKRQTLRKRRQTNRRITRKAYKGFSSKSKSKSKSKSNK